MTKFKVGDRVELTYPVPIDVIRRGGPTQFIPAGTVCIILALPESRHDSYILIEESKQDMPEGMSKESHKMFLDTVYFDKL